MTISNPVLEKVFLALRTDFVPDYKKEHVTLRYYKNIRWDVLLKDAERMDKKLPATIIHTGSVQSWNAGANRLRGLWVSSPDSTILDHLAMPHITLPTEVIKKHNVREFPSHEVVDTLWLGKSIKGHYMWAKVSGKDIQSGDIDWSATGLI